MIIKKYITTSVVLAMLNVFFVSFAFAETKEEAKRAAIAEKTKIGIEKLGTGPDAKLEVHLYNKTKIKGHIKEASPESFVIVDDKTSVETEVAYSSVKQIRGNNLTRGAKILIGVGIIIAIAVLVATQTK